VINPLTPTVAIWVKHAVPDWVKWSFDTPWLRQWKGKGEKVGWGGERKKGEVKETIVELCTARN